MKKLEKAQSRIEELAVKDEMTRLYNRRYFNARVNDEVKRSHRFRQNLGCIMLDIDFFKKVNDTYGHQAGDMILQNISKAVVKCCREIDTIARYGGEEIIVLLPGTDLKGAYHLADKIRLNVEELKNEYEKGVFIPVTVSLGVASFTPDDLNKITKGDQIIKYADSALYRAKERGRNRVEVAESVIM
jgi:diguanylate cyclase (GGDEF)-like protein